MARNSWKQSIVRGACFSHDDKYRYLLLRKWGEGNKLISWIMRRPTSANADKDSNTISCCIRFSRDWGFSCMLAVNLYAIRNVDFPELKNHPAPIGNENDMYILHAIRSANTVVCAWGGKVPKNDERKTWVLEKIIDAGKEPHHIVDRSNGIFRHPLGASTSLIHAPIPVSAYIPTPVDTPSRRD